MDLSLGEAAKILDIPEPEISRFIKDRRLPAFMINGRYRINRVDLLEWANHHKIPAKTLYSAAEGEVPFYPLDSLLEGNIHYGIAGEDQKAVLTHICELLPFPNSQDRDLALTVLLEQGERTTVLNGIAIPHARSPLIFGIEKPVLAICFLKEMVPFKKNPSGEVILAKVVFVLLSPTIRAHLLILSKIAEALHRPDFREKLDQRSSADEILASLRNFNPRP